jgi:hypothetical protein
MNPDPRAPVPDLSRVRAFMSRVEIRPADRSVVAPPSSPERVTLDVRHNLTFDSRKGRHVARFTVDRGGKLVGKRVAIRIPTTDAEIAVMVRDAVLDFCLAVGLRITRRAQKRKQNGGRR